MKKTYHEAGYFGRELQGVFREKSGILREMKKLIDDLERFNQEYWNIVMFGHPIKNAQQAGEYARTLKMGNERQVQINRQLAQISKDLGAML